MPSSHFKEAGHGIQNQSETHPGTSREESLSKCNRKHSQSVYAFHLGRLQSMSLVKALWRVTLKPLHEECKTECKEWCSGNRLLKFCKTYGKFIGSKDFANHIIHKPGDRIKVGLVRSDDDLFRQEDMKAGHHLPVCRGSRL